MVVPKQAKPLQNWGPFRRSGILRASVPVKCLNRVKRVPGQVLIDHLPFLWLSLAHSMNNQSCKGRASARLYERGTVPDRARIEPSRSRYACNNQLRIIRRGAEAWLSVIANGASAMMVDWGSIISTEALCTSRRASFVLDASAAKKNKTPNSSTRSYLARFLGED